MRVIKSLVAVLALLGTVTVGSHAHAQAASAVPERILGKADAPITVQEFVSLTCSHCAEFYNDTLPKLEKDYVETGKVRFILRDFPLDGVGLKAAAIARCMPEEQYYPFVKLLYKNQQQWAFGKTPEQTLLQYARLGGLSDDKAKECLANTKLLDAIVDGRTKSTDKYNIEATPTFVINDDAKNKIIGGRPAAEFAAAFDKILAEKAKK